MGRMEELETKLNQTQARLEEAELDNRKDDMEKLEGEIDRIRCELHTYEDNWVPGSSDTDFNELA